LPSVVESLRRHLALGRAVLRSRRRAFDPFKLTWILGEQCSLRCRTCGLWHAPHPGPSPEDVAAVVAANPQLTWVNLSGGDFVERDDAPRLVETIATGLPDLALLDFPTAGQDEDAALAALQPALDSDVPRIFVTVSIDGPDDVHDHVRRTPGAAARARATYRRLSALRRPGLRVVVGTTLSRHNLTGSADLDRVLPQDVPSRDVHLNLAHESDHYYRTAGDVTAAPERAADVVAALRNRRRWSLSPLALMESRYWALAAQYLRDGRVEGSCGALVASVFLASDLTLYPCSIHDRPLGRLPDLGWSLRNLAGRPDAESARDEARRGACPGCWSPCEAFPTLLAGFGRTL
jgi:MoaA/NifB/PqqE/SkfB family radical SAM enzyme